MSAGFASPILPDPARWTPVHQTEVVSWQAHIPFAMDLVRALRPRVLVELGTHKGDSYFAFCEAVRAAGLDTACYAVDTWKGDAHAGLYGENVYAGVERTNAERYAAFSTLVRSTFDEALDRFADGSVDLLHIDGLHTYDAVAHDFNTWRPKLSERGVVLFHDTEVRQGDFGVWRYWQELCARYPSFSFRHGHGLGVLAVGEQAPDLLPELFRPDAATADAIRWKYETLGRAVAYDGMHRLFDWERRRRDDEQLQEREQARAWYAELCRVHEELEQSKAEVQNLAAEVQRQAQVSARLAEEKARMAASVSWRITAPVRLAASAPRILRRAVTDVLRVAYHGLPVPAFWKDRVKEWCYAHLAIAFRHTPSYALWKSRQAALAPAGAPLISPSADLRQGFDFLDCDAPTVSIVIPVYGKVEYTHRCLRSIRSVPTRHGYEIIVVDDCSPDETAAVLDRIGGIRVVRNEENLGFIRSCNRGAAQARGALLLFLNNDTEVRPGWLDELVETFNLIPGAGLVGAKLVYPNGRLQEAGGIIWNDGSGWNVGRLGDPRMPEHNYLRDVDYCSGAAVMLPAELFRKLGGFDEYYVPAYGEDSDLAFKVRAAGGRVLYQPLAEVVHHEGVTSGTDVGAGVKAYQVENARKLFERWRDALRDHGVPGVAPHLAKDRRITGRVLVLDHCTPTPDRDAGSITLLNLMRILQSMGLKVTFAPEDNMLYLERYTADLQRIGIECLYGPYVRSLQEHLERHGKDYDAVLLCRVTVAERHLAAIRRYCPQAKILFHTSDLHHLREQRQAELEGSRELMETAAARKEAELGIIRQAHATVVHSTVEKDILDEELGWGDASRIFVFPWAIEVPGSQAPFERRDGIVFIGGYQHLPNVDAVEYFAREIFPLVRRRLPEARFYIVGSQAPASFQALAGNGVQVVGFVEDLGAVLDRCRLSVAPLRYGAGIKGKVAMSMSYGLPCVATPMGAEGMGLVDGNDILVADTPEGFADAVVRLHQDAALWRTLSENGVAVMRARYSLESGRALVREILASVGLDGGRLADRPLAGAIAERFPRTCQVTAVSPETRIEGRAQFDEYLTSPAAQRQRAQELAVIQCHPGDQGYTLFGRCEVCDRDTLFLVDRLCGPTDLGDGLWEPNWRERAVCPACQLNTRQRVIAARVRQFVAARAGARADVYLMEQVTPIFAWLKDNVAGARFVGSEYLGPSLAGGAVRDGVRHEDVERLSFPDAAFDLVVSDDVLEHVNDPLRALREVLRVLRPGGVLLLTVPFDPASDANVRRAELSGGGVKHLLPAVYHGNPVSQEGSLVFTDFGWELLAQIREIGFRDVAMHLYWSRAHGYFGVGQHYLRAVKPQPDH